MTKQWLSVLATLLIFGIWYGIVWYENRKHKPFKDEDTNQYW